MTEKTDNKALIETALNNINALGGSLEVNGFGSKDGLTICESFMHGERLCFVPISGLSGLTRPQAALYLNGYASGMQARGK